MVRNAPTAPAAAGPQSNGAEAAALEEQFASRVLTPLRDHVHDPANGVRAEDGTLGPANHFDAFDVDERNL